MNRQQLLVRLNRRASTRYQSSEITDGIFGNWLEAKLIRAPDKHGRERNWTYREYRRALEIVRLRWLGVETLGEIRIMCYLKGFDVPFLASEFDDRRILTQINLRSTNKLVREIHSTYPMGRDTSVTGWPARSVIRNLGPLDSSLEPVIKYRNEELLEFFVVSKIGLGQIKYLRGTCGRVFEYLVQNPFFQKLTFDKCKELIAAELNELPLLFRSTLTRGDQIEGPQARAIRLATPEQFETARRLLRTITRLFARMGLRKVANSALHPTWRIPVFIFLLHVIFRASRTGRLKSLFEPEELKRAEDLLFN